MTTATAAQPAAGLPVHYLGRAFGNAACETPRPPVDAGRLTADRGAVTCGLCTGTRWYAGGHAEELIRDHLT